MKIWQWASIMWMLSMICYYVSGEILPPLITAFVFAAVAGFALGTKQ